jgi:putative pyruvate formate lyase activating enzyme
MNLDNCNICPRNCGVNRNNNELGFCKANNKIKIARYSLHYWEEPCISGKRGSGTIFFSGCNLKCIFCQNYDISFYNKGKEISIERFADICIELQNKKALNINLVTPTIYIPLIKEGLLLAKKKGLKIPIVYNTSGYESVESLKELDGLIDIYLPDFKYFDNSLAKNFSMTNNYFEIASSAIKEMYRQVGKPKFRNNLIKKGVIVRHLLLPNHINDSKKVIKYLYDNYKDNIYISIMNQYTPIRKIENYKELNKTVSEKEYDELINYALDLGIKNAYIQEGETCKESFIPDFTNYDNI